MVPGKNAERRKVRMTTKKIQLNSLLIQGNLVKCEDPNNLIIESNGQFFRIIYDQTTQISRTVTWTKGEGLRIVGRLVNFGGTAVFANYIEASLDQSEFKPNDVQWLTKYVFKDPEGYWFITEDEAVLGPYKTQSEAQKAFDTYVESL